MTTGRLFFRYDLQLNYKLKSLVRGRTFNYNVEEVSRLHISLLPNPTLSSWLTSGRAFGHQNLQASIPKDRQLPVGDRSVNKSVLN